MIYKRDDFRKSNQLISSAMQICALEKSSSSAAWGRMVRTAMTAQSIGAGVSSHPETGVHDLGSGGSDEIQSVHLAKALQVLPKIMLG